MGYLFDPEALYAIVSKAQGLELDELLDAVLEGFASKYPGHVVTGPPDWILLPNGGILGELAVLHASVREYLSVFGAPVFASGEMRGPTIGHTWDFILQGQMTLFEEGELEPRAFSGGEFTSLSSRRHLGVKFAAGTWILEYSRGPMASLLGSGLTAGVTQWRDPMATLRHSRTCLANISRELVRGKV